MFQNKSDRRSWRLSDREETQPRNFPSVRFYGRLGYADTESIGE
jgi:hypothetical protein